MTNFDYVLALWRKLDIEPGDQQILRGELGKLIAAFSYDEFEPTNFQEAIETVKSIERKYNIDDYSKPLPIEPSLITREGIDELIGGLLRGSIGSVIGLIGPPGCGKTTFLKELEFTYGERVYFADEYWDKPGSEDNGLDYKEKKGQVSIAISQGMPSLVAAGWLEDVETKIYLEQPIANRKSNISGRLHNDSDSIRLAHPEITDPIDFHFYVLPKMVAQFKFDAIPLRY